jgi:hypothetical protein
MKYDGKYCVNCGAYIPRTDEQYDNPHGTGKVCADCSEENKS